MSSSSQLGLQKRNLLLGASFFALAIFVWGWLITGLLFCWFNINIFLLRNQGSRILGVLIFINTLIFLLSKLVWTSAVFSGIIGFAFYYFHLISALLFLNRRLQSTDFSWVNLNLYLFYFPKVAAGPIVGANAFLNDLSQWKPFSVKGVWFGLHLFLIGFAKFFLLLPTLDIGWNFLWNSQSSSLLVSLLLVFSSALKIYVGFSGAIDMVRGLSFAIGIYLPRNFDFPYLARNPQDFWMRWHITFTNWLTENVFYPVARKTRSIYLAIILTISLMGVTHGGGWGFLLSGFYAGLGVMIFNLMKERLTWIYCRLSASLKLIWDYVFWLFNQLFMQFGLFLLVSSTESNFLQRLKVLFSYTEMFRSEAILPGSVVSGLLYVLIPLAVLDRIQFRYRSGSESFNARDCFTIWAVCGILGALTLTLSSEFNLMGSNFLYFRF